jgi:hypothetical protein
VPGKTADGAAGSFCQLPGVVEPDAASAAGTTTAKATATILPSLRMVSSVFSM